MHYLHRVTWLYILLLLIPTLASAIVTLPVEIMGPAGTIESVSVNVPNASGVNKLWLQVHNLSYPNPYSPQVKASVQVNSGSWIDSTNTTTDVAEPGKSWGGIGGGFSSLKLTIPLPSGLVVTGSNTVRFRFTTTDGVSSGYRVVKFNFLSGGNPVVPASEFFNENPSTWLSPSGADANRGRQLWQTAALKKSPLNSSIMQAKCMDCHTRDGRDLKYFNYSNKSIFARAQFHGLSVQDGADIAAYIRTLPVAAAPNGRPWNPPYQPGPGLDKKPISEWAAGAGVDAILDSDQDMLPYIFPNGIRKQEVATTGNLNIREIPISIQMLDWNHWLPKTHPLDGWSEFASSQGYAKYFTARTAATANQLVDFGDWGYYNGFFIGQQRDKLAGVWTPELSQNIYNLRLWELVKNFEIMQEFGLETKEKNIAYLGIDPGRVEPRGWTQQTPFMTSPFMLQLPIDSNAIDGSKVKQEYFTNAWYYLQLILFTHHKNEGNTPQDWGYLWGNLAGAAKYYPEGMRTYLFMAKSGQIHENGLGPDYPLAGWRPDAAPNISGLSSNWKSADYWKNTPPATKTAMLTALIEAWQDKNESYPNELYTIFKTAGGQPAWFSIVSSRDEVPSQNADGRFIDKIFDIIPDLRSIGVNEPLLTRIINWAQGMWPKGAWDLLRVPSTLSMDHRLPIYRKDANWADNSGEPYIAPATIRFATFAEGDMYLYPQEVYANGVKVGDGVVQSNPRDKRFQWDNVPAGTYNIEARAKVGNTYISSGTFNVVVRNSSGALPPTFMNQPASITTLAGDIGTFKVDVAGDGPMTVQWQMSTDGGSTYNSISGATGGLYTTPTTSLSHSGRRFRVVATNLQGSVTSSASIMTVVNAFPSTPTTKAPELTIQPLSTSVAPGENANFVIGATGIPYVTYQWQFRASSSGTFSNLAGETSRTLSRTNIQLVNSGSQFRCIATNSIGSVTSSIANLTVTTASDLVAPGAPRNLGLSLQ